ncbi:hypothetical protein D9M70_438390 [compost metagenome]
MADTQHGAPLLFREVNYGLERSADIVGAVHVALHHVDHRIEQQQRDPTDCLHSVAQQVEVGGRVEGLTLAQGIDASLDDVDAIQVCTGSHQTRHQRVGWIILGGPDQGVALLVAVLPVRPASATGDGSNQANGEGGLTAAARPGQEGQLASGNPARPQPADRYRDDGGGRGQFRAPGRRHGLLNQGDGFSRHGQPSSWPDH